MRLIFSSEVAVIVKHVSKPDLKTISTHINTDNEEISSYIR